MAEEIDIEKCNFQNFRSPVTFALILDRVIRHTVVHRSSTSIYSSNLTEIGKTFMDGRTYGRTYWRTFQTSSRPNVIRSTRRIRPKNGDAQKKRSSRKVRGVSTVYYKPTDDVCSQLVHTEFLTKLCTHIRNSYQHRLLESGCQPLS